MTEMQQEETENRQKHSKTFKLVLWVGISFFILLLLAIFPLIYITKGYRMARYADSHGVFLLVDTSFDGSGYSMKASEKVLRKEVEFDQRVYEELQSELPALREL